jgi:outer membrane protein assembly complex protein YaeT
VALLGLSLALAAAVGSAFSKPDVRFVGLESISAAEAEAMIAPQLEWIAKDSASPALADDAAYFLEQAMRSQGFPEADVVPEIDPTSNRLTLRVDEGARRRLGEITFTGNVAQVPEAELKALIKRSTANRSEGLKLAKKSLPFVRRDIESGMDDVAAYYQSLGYLDAKVAPLGEGASGNVVPVEVAVDAGMLYKIGAISVSEGNDTEGSDLDGLMGAYRGKPATAENLTDTRFDVSSHFRQRGYYKTEIELNSKRGDGLVDLFFEVRKGDRYAVGELEIEGNDRVRSDFLKQRFAKLEGLPYSAAATDKVYRELLSTGLFETMSIVPEERGDGTVDLKVNVSEAKTRELAVLGGYGTFEGGIVAVSLQERNLFGRGRQLRGKAELTSRGVSGDIGYSDRWFLDSPLRFESSLFSARKELEGYEKLETGLRGEFIWPVSEHFSTGAFAQISFTDIFESQIDDAFLGDRTYRLGSVGLSANYDTRDDPLNPRSGLQAMTTIEYGSQALGGEVEFLRGTLRLAQHFPIGKRSALRFGARSGFLTGVGDTDVIPIDLRYFSGGSTSVRSFDERHLGPNDGSGHPLGGEFFTIFNAEYNFPLLGIVKGATFFDGGNLLTDFDDIGLDDMHYAAGLGLRIDLPTGPVRLDYGWNLNREGFEPGGAFHVSVGLAF